MTQISNRRPLVGTAIMLDDLDHIDGLYAFIRDRDRDIEIQDLGQPDAVRSDWSPIAERARKIFDGHGGRIGIHGPFHGFALDAYDADVRALVRTADHATTSTSGSDPRNPPDCRAHS